MSPAVAHCSAAVASHCSTAGILGNKKTFSQNNFIMNTIVFIINGISLPYHVIDYAVKKAKENSARIFGLFLKGKHEPSKS